MPRGRRRNFYAGAGGRLWYYMNNYYWVSETAPLEDLWIKAEVEDFKEKRLADINTQIDTAQQQLKANLDGFAKDMAGKILGRAL